MQRCAIAGLCLYLCTTSVVHAVPTVSFEINPGNTVPGVVARSVIVDGQGADWIASVLLIELTQGSVYNDPLLTDEHEPMAGLWTVPGLEQTEFDTWVGIPNDNTSGLAGPAGDLGNGTFSMSGDTISVSWFNTLLTDVGPTRIANISLTDDAEGTWQLLSAFGDGSQRIQNSGYIPEPASLALLATGGFVLLRRY